MRPFITSLVGLAVLVSLVTPVASADPSPTQAAAPCTVNLLVNPGFEDGGRKTLYEGTSISSSVANGWEPWAIRGNASVNREPEFKLEDTNLDPTGTHYRAHSGRYSQKFFTTWATHTAGFYQRVAVPPGSTVTFSIWVQIYTGQTEVMSNGKFISDLQKGNNRGPGNYRTYVGIDPSGGTIPFGAEPPSTVVWSSPLLDRQERTTDAQGNPIDAWTQMSVSAVAQGGYVTVFTKGQPEFGVKHNDSFWDDACLSTGASLPVAPVPAPTTPPTVAAPASGCSYTVRSGDTLGQIAARHGITYQAIAASNHIADPNLIFPGQVLNVCS